MISIIVPIYNVEKYVGECIESIINQAYKDLEIILVDDGSTDGSGIICDKYARHDSRIHVIHKTNGGLSDARNAGIEQAHGDWLGFVDGDDFLHKNMYADLYSCIRSTDGDIAVCSFFPTKCYVEDWEYDKNDEISVFSGGEALCNLNIVQVSACNKLYRKELFETIRYPVGKLHEDEAVIHRILYQCSRVSFIEEKLYGRRIREGSIMTSEITGRRIYDGIDALKDRVNFVCEMGWEEPQENVLNRFGEYVRHYYFYVEEKNIRDYKEVQIMLREELRRLMVNRKKDFRFEFRVFNTSPRYYRKCRIIGRIWNRIKKRIKI